MKRAMLMMVLLVAALVPGDAWGRIFRRGYYGGYSRPYVNTGVYVGPRYYRPYYPSYGGYGRYYGGYGGYGYGYRGYSPYYYGRGFGVYPGGVGISVGGFF